MSRQRLETVLDEMVAIAEADLNLVALAMAVSIPAICASLSMPGGRSGGGQYTDWCRANLYPDKGMDYITADELYALRNGLLHEGRTRMVNFSRKTKMMTAAGPLDGVRFVTRGNDGGGFGNCRLNNYWLYSVVFFCRSMRKAAVEWLEKQDNNPVVQANLDKMIAYHPFDNSGPLAVDDELGLKMVY